MTDFVEIPGLNMLIELLLADGRSFRSRIEGADGLLITVAAPLGPGDLDLPRAGETVSICWTGLRGQYSAPAVLVSIDRRPPARWTVEATGTVEIVQRRRYARAAGDVPVRLRHADDAENGATGETVNGRLIDVSEGSMRCWVPGGSGFRAGETVCTTLVLGDHLLSMDSTVYRVDGSHKDDGLELVALFAATPVQAETLRRYVLYQQVQARKAREDATG